MPLARLFLAALATLLGASSFACAQEVVLTHSAWFQRAEDRADTSTRVYRRFTMTSARDLTNVELFHCPRDRDTFVHISFELRKVRDLKKDFPQEFTKFEGRFLVDGKSAFSIPGELIKNEMFFDRTPQTYDDFDTVTRAKEVILLFGSGNAGVKFIRSAELDADMLSLLRKAFSPMVRSFTATEVLQDCIRYRGSR